MSVIHFKGAPWLQSSTSSASGQRVLRNRDFKSSSTSSSTEMRKGFISLMDISFDALTVKLSELDTTGGTGFRKPSAINIAAAATKLSVVEVQIPQLRRKR